MSISSEAIIYGICTILYVIVFGSIAIHYNQVEYDVIRDCNKNVINYMTTPSHIVWILTICASIISNLNQNHNKEYLCIAMFSFTSMIFVVILMIASPFNLANNNCYPKTSLVILIELYLIPSLICAIGILYYLGLIIVAILEACHLKKSNKIGIIQTDIFNTNHALLDLI